MVLAVAVIVAGAPPERAGSAASLAQSANGIGIATGLVILGSIGTAVYRSRIGSADGSWADGFRQAASTGDATLLRHVRDAFISGFRAVGIFGLAVLAIVLLLRLARRRKA
jgi:DHA2 family multidrug resistance protein-like MFS transporter